MEHMALTDYLVVTWYRIEKPQGPELLRVTRVYEAPNRDALCRYLKRGSGGVHQIISEDPNKIMREQLRGRERLLPRILQRGDLTFRQTYIGHTTTIREDGTRMPPLEAHLETQA